MSEPAEAAAAVGSPSRALRRGRPGGVGLMPDGLPVLVASPGRATRQRQQQEQEEALAAAMAMAGGASGGVHARRPSTSSSASSSSSSSSSTVSSDGGAGGETAAAAAGGLHGSPARRRRQQQQQQQAGGALGALPTLHHQVWAQPPSSPSKATRASSAAAAAGGMSIVAPSSPHGGLKHDPDHHQAQAPPPASPRPTERPPGQGQGEGGLQSSPLRRSQTQHVREAAEAAAAASDSAEAPPGAGALPPGLVAPRIGEQYQIPAEALPRDERDDVGASCYDPWNIAACAQKGLVWHPGDVGEEVAELFAGEVQASMADGRCGDEGAELGWLVLRATGSVERAVAAAEDETLRGQWSREEEAAFVQGIKDHDKNFRRIKESLPNRSLAEVIRHFYLWKQSDEYRTWKAERPLQYVEQAIPDYHADVCDKCEKPGDLLCCDTCNLAFHMRCLGLREHEVPDDFSCEECQKQYTTQAERERAKRWVEFQVNRVLAQREKELQKVDGEQKGYIGRMRASSLQQGQKKKRRKRKRQDCNGDGGEGDEDGEDGPPPPHVPHGMARRSSEAATATAATAASASAAAAAGGGCAGQQAQQQREPQQQQGGGGGSQGTWTSLLRPLPPATTAAASSSSSVSSEAEEGKQPGGGGGSGGGGGGSGWGGGGGIDYSSSASSNASSQRRRSGRVAAVVGGGVGGDAMDVVGGRRWGWGL